MEIEQIEKMQGVREYAEEMPVEFVFLKKSSYPEQSVNRWVIQATNEAGCNCTQVDFIDVLEWVLKNKPTLLESLIKK
jgi:hypothetical protein